MTASPGDGLTLQLLRRWNGGEDAALHQLLERHLSWVTNYVHGRLGEQLRSRDETQDYVQGAMLDFLRFGPRLEVSDEDAFRALLARVAENNIRDRKRYFASRKRGGSGQGPAELRAPSDSVLDLDARRRVTRPSEHAQRDEHISLVRLALELLGPQDRDILRLRQFDELPFADIAERMSVSEDAARMRFQRALPKLAQKVAELEEKGLAVAIPADPPADPPEGR